MADGNEGSNQFDSWCQGLGVSFDASPHADAEMPTRNVDTSPGWLDAAFGLNPSRSFTKAGLDWEYGPNSPLTSKPGDSDLTTLGRAGLNVAAIPLTAEVVFGGLALDAVNNLPFGDFGEPAREGGGGILPPEPMKGNDAPTEGPTPPGPPMPSVGPEPAPEEQTT